MSVHSLKRRFLVPLALAFSAAPLFALNPSARNEVRMVFSPAIHRVVLYGGSTPIDHGTNKAYELSDTWERTTSKWIQRFPNHNPGPRGANAMVYDSNRNLVVVFGGHNAFSDYNDTWVYDGDDWVQLPTPNSPPARYLMGAAFDPVRDRIVMFGGSQHGADATVTPTALYDTWEFDGTTWNKVNSDGPHVTKPMLVYDAARAQTLMLALDAKAATLMYAWDPSSASWKQLTPTTLPGCVNEGSLAYEDANQKVFYTGGVCVGSSATEDNLEWDGTNWTKLDVTTSAGRVFGAAMTYDTERQDIVLFGGATVNGISRSSTLLFGNGLWLDVSAAGGDPSPRSLFTFVSDPVNNTIWMLGGVDDTQTFTDFWQFQNGHWALAGNGDEPTTCIYPIGAYDTDRQKMVVLCNDATTWELDSASQAWKQITGLNTNPPVRRFSAMVYDQSLKKTVVFGGYGTSYFDETWLWDGSTWTRVAKNNPPGARSGAMMWYDPNLKKTVMYGGVGRLTTDGRIVYYSDQWTFDGSNWTQMNPVKNAPEQSTGTPGARYGAQVAVDPRTNKTLLFGGLTTITDSTGTRTEVYASDTWEWDGTKWTQLSPDVVPPARENAGLAYDAIRNEMVMFSGFAGLYHNDTWGYTNGVWHQRIENSEKRRSTR